MLPVRFSIFGGGGDSKPVRKSRLPTPTVTLRADREVYWPGDEVTATVEISCPSLPDPGVLKNGSGCSLLIRRLGLEIKGIEKLDCQWFATQKPSPDSTQRRGEYVFMDGAAPYIISNLIVSPGSVKTYLVRLVLPSILPPSYKGATIRYLYYVKAVLSGQWQILDEAYSQSDYSKDLTEAEARVPLQLWVNQKNSGLHVEEGPGIVPSTTINLDMYWKEMDGESDWVKAHDSYDGVGEGYDSSKDEIASVSSFNAARGSMYRSFGSSLSLHSSPARSSSRDLLQLEGHRSSLSNTALPSVSISEVFNDGNSDTPSSKTTLVSPRQQRLAKSSSMDKNDETVSSVAAENFIRGRSYNIRLDDQVLLRFSPRNSDSTYYFSDMIGGTLTFFHEERARRCLEILITLEISETITKQYVHSSRRNSPTITKVQSDHHEVVADLIQTSFQFSIPMDGPMSFSTSRVSVQWSLRFEFYTTPKNVDWTRYEHPLLVEGREKSDWVLPITVHAPPSKSVSAQSRSEKSFSLEPMWVRT